MLAKLWRFLTASTFDVTTTRHDTAGVVIAGKRTNICTIYIHHYADAIFGRRQGEVDFPRPFIQTVPEVEVSYNERRPSREVVELDVYVHVTIAGTYSITPTFPENYYYFNLIDKDPVEFYVTPSEFKFLELNSVVPVLKIVNQDPATPSNVYRGDTAQMWVNPKDEYGNKHAGSNVNFEILSEGSYVKLGSVTQAQNSEQGNYVLTLHWVRAGMTSFDLTASQANRQVIVKDISINIIIPPVSATNSYIINSDLEEIQKRIYEFGKPITFKLTLIDILGNPITFAESADFLNSLSLVYHRDIFPNWSSNPRSSIERMTAKMKMKENTLRVYPSDSGSNICVLEFTPSVAGKRLYLLKDITSSEIRITVLPREGQDMEIINSEAAHDIEMKVVPYMRKDYIEFYESDQKILCMGVERRQLVGEDNGNIKNINRVLEKEYKDFKLSNDEISQKYGLLVLFDVGCFPKDAALKVFDLLSILVEGSHHYRNEAHEFGDMVKEWAEEARKAFLDDDFGEAGRCKRIKEPYVSLMNQSNRKASDAIFKFYNYGRPQSEIDLHGQLVADLVKLNSYREQLLSRGDKSAAEVDAIIERERQERNEAIRKLGERLRTFDHEEAKRIGEDWLEIIDGAGHHSAKRGKQKIRPKVQEYLRKKDLKYVEANEGALLITFSEYTGREPCVADFYCRRCKKTWTSISSWKGFYQRCFRCDRKQITSECYPFKLRSVLPERRKQTSDFTAADHRRLCQKCIQLQSDCRR